MTTYKPRQAGSEHEAIEQAVQLLGTKRIAHEIGRTPTYVLRAANPDEDVKLQLRDALTIDRLCQRDHGHAPITAWMQGQTGGEPEPKPVNLASALLDLNVIVGRVAETIRCAKAPTGPGGRRITQTERTSVCRHIDMAVRHLRETRRSVAAHGDCDEPRDPDVIAHDFAREVG